MGTLENPLKIDVVLREALSWVGVAAEKTGTQQGHDAAQLCLELASAVGEHETIPVRVPIRKLLAHACDELRARGKTDQVDQVERIVAFLKRGQNRVIKASLGFRVRDVNELDDQYEQVRKQFAR